MKKILLLLQTVLLCCCPSDNVVMAAEPTVTDKITITIGGRTQSITLCDNDATKALVEKLQQAPVSVTLTSSGGFEIWGALGFSLPTTNQQTTAQPGDVILYNGSNICLFYGSNTWSYTRLGKIDGLSENELATFLKAGESNITVTLSLPNMTGFKNLRPASLAITGDAIYSLNGARTITPFKGLYIKHGKIVMK